MRRLICTGIYWLIEPLLDLLDERKAKLAIQQAEYFNLSIEPREVRDGH